MMPGKKCVMFHFFSFFHDGWRSRKVKKKFVSATFELCWPQQRRNNNKKDVKTGETTTTGHPQVGQGEKNRKSYKIK
jgi:hypothetical protein